MTDNSLKNIKWLEVGNIDNLTILEDEYVHMLIKLFPSQRRRIKTITTFFKITNYDCILSIFKKIRTYALCNKKEI